VLAGITCGVHSHNRFEYWLPLREDDATLSIDPAHASSSRAAATAPLQGRVSLVTGASRGIGEAVSHVLARAGADVAVNDREREAAAANVVRQIDRLGRRALAVRADVTVREQVRAMVSHTLKTLGTIDILINNTGLLQQKPFADSPTRTGIVCWR
jgi:hypothetical protein